MSTLTKEQVQNLTPDQQEAFAMTLTSRAQWRQELLKHLRPQWPYRIAVGIIVAAAIALAVFQAGQAPLLSSCVVLLALALQLHSNIVHRRLDAVVTLLNVESAPGTGPKKPESLAA